MDNNKLFVGNLSWDTTDETLKAFFEQIGEVVEAKVIFDRNTNRSKGFGFVTMANAEDAKKALEELNDKELDGRAIKVADARPQQPRN
jgi:RNA recognition motif-containing protein